MAPVGRGGLLWSLAWSEGTCNLFQTCWQQLTLLGFVCLLLPQVFVSSSLVVLTEGRLRRRRYGALCCGRQCQEGAAFAFAHARTGAGENDVTVHARNVLAY